MENLHNNYCEKIKIVTRLPVTVVVKTVENAVINIRLVRLSPREWPKVGRGTAK